MVDIHITGVHYQVSDKVKTYIQEALTGYSPLRAPYGAPPYVRAMTTIQAA